MLDFAECERLVSSARDKRSKPVANNTRVERRGENAYALRLHGTDIATFHRDGRITINSGGYRTVTTAARLGEFVTHRRYAENGTWYVQAEPAPNDPQPARAERTIPKPFYALDPGPEPQKPAEGCLAGTVREEPYEEEALVSKHDIADGTWSRESIIREYTGGGDYFVGYAIRRGYHRTYFGEQQGSWTTPDFLERIEREFGTGSINDRDHYKQCPHCELFERQHRAWDAAMNGSGWGRNRTHSYAKMVELLEQYGSREAWQEAYLADFRRAREQGKLVKAWTERNRVLFEDGMEINADGYAKRPDPKAIARDQRKAKKIEKKKARINEFVADAMKALADGVPMPSGGDCWGCHLRDVNDPNAEAMGVDHLEQHIKERYYVPSMFVNALRDTGYQDAGIYMMLGMNPEEGTMGGNNRIHEDTVTRALRRYLYKRLLETHGAAVHA